MISLPLKKKRMKKDWVVFVFVVLFLCDIFLCYRLISQSKSIRQLRNKNQKLEISVTESERLRENLWHETMVLDEALIEDVLLCLDSDSVLHSKSKILVLFFPPNVCGSCAQDQCEIVSRNLANINELIIMFPSYKIREMFTWFSETDNVRLIEYEQDSLKSESIIVLEKALLFQVGNSRVTNIALSDQNNPFWTQDYINKYCLNNERD